MTKIETMKLNLRIHRQIKLTTGVQGMTGNQGMTGIQEMIGIQGMTGNQEMIGVLEIFSSPTMIASPEVTNQFKAIAPLISVVEEMERSKGKNALLDFIGSKANLHVTGQSCLVVTLLNHEKAMENVTKASSLHGQEIVESIEDVFIRNIKNFLVNREPIGIISFKFVIILPTLVVQEVEVHHQVPSKETLSNY